MGGRSVPSPQGVRARWGPEVIGYELMTEVVSGSVYLAGLMLAGLVGVSFLGRAVRRLFAAAKGRA